MVDTNMITFIDRVGVAVAACAKAAYSAIRAPVVPRRMPITALMPPRVPE